MTKINKLIMHGFKSFAKRTELLFTNDFNCVLGPNGSGKSNILDALCFVLGKTSAKAMRSENSASLIYNGGKAKTPAKNAEVSIFFDNKNNTFPTEDEEVKVTRIVTQKGVSKYKINDQTRTRGQIIELLNLAKIDPNGYNIILQGDIVRFCEMASETRRELIEEISGISVYEDKKQKAINELEKVEEKLKEAEVVLAERGTYLKELKKEKEQAEKYKDLDKKIKTGKASVLNNQITKKKETIEKLEEKITKINEVLNKIRGETKELKDTISEKKEQIDEINKEIETKGEKEQVSLHKEVEELKVGIATSKHKIDSLKNEITRVEQRKEQLNENIRDIKEKVDELNEEKKGFHEEISKKDEELKGVESKITQFKKKNELDSVGDIEKDVDNLDKQAEDMQKEISDLRQEQQELLREKDKLEFEINTIDERIAKVLAVEKENKAQIEELKDKQKKFKEATSELTRVINENSSISAQLGTARGSLNSANEETSKLKAKSLSFKEAFEANAAIREITKQKFKGVYGTVSELGKVSSKYAMALEIAAGSKIKSIVVDTDSTAAKCIKFLKDNKHGTATFIPLNKIHGRSKDPAVANIAKSDGVHGFAIDLVDHENKFSKAFSHVFGSTLVVENLDVARRLGIGSAKMVSLDGDLAERSGVMHGGYRQKQARIGFQEKELDKDLAESEKNLRDAELLVTRLEKERDETEGKIAGLRETKSHLEGDVIKLEKALHLDSDDLNASNKKKKECEQGIKDTENKIDEVVNKISEINSSLAGLKTQKQDLREKISELRNPVLLAELNTFEEKRNEIKDELLKLNGDMRNIDIQIETMFGPENENTLKIIKQHEKEKEDFEIQINELKTTIETKTKQLAAKEEKEEKFRKQFKGLFEKRGKLDEEIDGKEEKIEVISDKIRKEELILNSANLESARFKGELAGLDKEFEQYEGVELDNQTPEPELKRRVTHYENLLLRMDTVNMKALEVYDDAEKEFSSLLSKKDTLSVEKEDVLVMMNEIETKKKDLFMKSFDVVNDEFRGIFSELTTKGDASLVLENVENPFEGGVLIKVKITGKRFMDIRSLSGGEKTMTALAFIFAIQENDPASFYVLDEVDAALDKHNSEKLAKLVRKYAERAQYIMISHNDGMIAEADTLYGISMNEHGISNSVSLKI
ncbi:chromosome segregation protein SMC [Nanoarchaeota archaeon]